jgi:predicted permease
VRQAIGAGRTRLVTQLLTETLLLFAVGGGVGVALAFWATRVVGSLPITLDAPLTGEYAPDMRILLVSLSITLTAGMVFGLAPALRATKADVASVLREERGQAPGRHRLRKAFLVAQVAGSVVLMGGSGVLFRALSRAGSMDLGFEPEGVHVATVNLGIQQYSEEEGRAFFSRLLEGGRALPGVEAAALTDFVFLASPPERGGAFSTPDTDGTAFGGIFGVSPEFFETIGTEILEGRSFDATDGIDTAPVAIVNERVAGILWPGESLLGKTLQHGELSFTVIGMAEDSKYISIGEPPLVGVFLPQAQDYTPTTSLLLRMRGGGRDIRRQVAELVRGLDPDVPLSDNGPHTELLGRQLLPRRMAATFGGILGLVGLFLASVGLYGLLSHLTTQRSSELAIRIALGAQPGSVRRSVVRTGLGLVAIGLAAGLPLALGLSSLIRRFLYGLDPVDPVIIAAIICVIGAIGLAASYLPALRATRLDPVAVLRQP